MADQRGTCKNCGKKIVKWDGADWWEHWDTSLYMCDNEDTMAEPE